MGSFLHGPHSAGGLEPLADVRRDPHGLDLLPYVSSSCGDYYIIVTIRYDYIIVDTCISNMIITTITITITNIIYVMASIQLYSYTAIQLYSYTAIHKCIIV